MDWCPWLICMWKWGELNIHLHPVRRTQHCPARSCSAFSPMKKRKGDGSFHSQPKKKKKWLPWDSALVSNRSDFLSWGGVMIFNNEWNISHTLWGSLWDESTMVIISRCHVQIKPFKKTSGPLIRLSTSDHSTLDAQQRSAGASYVISAYFIWRRNWIMASYNLWRLNYWTSLPHRQMKFGRRRLLFILK